ncbi:iron-containing alcohol dehydrogenase family protein [Halobacteriales archaeon Cl-PHB]
MTESAARPAGFRFEYDPPTVRFGPGSAADLGDELQRLGADRALVVCGRTVGDTPAVMDPVREGLGERLAGIFAETTPAKRLSTAIAGAERFEAADADAIVAVGGGSSLDVATVTRAILADDRPADEIGQEFAETGTVSVADDLPPLVVVPTTLAGADLSQVAGLAADPEGGLVESPVSGGVSDPALMPSAAVYDPVLAATTPVAVLAGSAMNGFDKGIETVYAGNATPITDATAADGLGLLAEHLPRLEAEGATPAVLEPILEGIVLVQYGISRPQGSTLSVIHAFGHGLTWRTDLQQGVAHGVVAPHVLRYLFENVDGRRDLLAEALDVEAADPADGVVDAVTAVRDGLGLPRRLRDVDGHDPEDFDAVAEYVLDDAFMQNAPPALDPSADDLRAVLDAAW